MLTLVYCAYVLFLSYAILQLFFAFKWLTIRQDNIYATQTTYFSVIVPFKNEESNLTNCIQSILNQNYPPSNFEILLIDDHSTDQSQEIALRFNENFPDLIQYKLSNGNGKKAAIATGIVNSKFQHIITIDADCTVDSKWLNNFDSYFIDSSESVIVGPVLLKPGRETAFHYFQALEFMGLNVITIVAGRNRYFYNGSGANLGFTKSIYQKYRESESDKSISSGDDIFLIASAVEQKTRVIYPKNKSMVAYSQTETNWNAFINQRLRWGAKSRFYPTNLLFLTWLLPVLSSFGIVMILVLGCITFSFLFFELLVFSLLLKFATDYCLLKVGNDFYRSPGFRFFIISELYHIFYLNALSLRMLFSRNFNWKGRSLNK